jgi:hypothetical protein
VDKKKLNFPMTEHIERFKVLEQIATQGASVAMDIACCRGGHLF